MLHLKNPILSVFQASKMAVESIWDRREDESDRAYAAFCLYLTLPSVGRSIDRAADAARQKNGDSTADGQRAPRNWFTWSSDHAWVDRAAAYDAHLELQARAQREADHLKDIADLRRLAIDEGKANIEMARKIRTVVEAGLKTRGSKVKAASLSGLARAAAALSAVGVDQQAEALGVHEIEGMLAELDGAPDV